jgi:hypothetical protein
MSNAMSEKANMRMKEGHEVMIGVERTTDVITQM